MMKKKSQITVFIIIGIILLFSTALVLYIKERVGVPEREVKLAVEKVPTEIQPVQIYVTECIDKLATDAIKKIGAHGGYLSTDEKDFDLTLTKFKENDKNPTEADVVPFVPGSRIRVPYWYYMKSKNDCDKCAFASLQPPLYRTQGGNSIESQIDRYIDINLRACINNFEPFRKEGFTVNEKGSIRTTTYVKEKDVIVYVDYPVDLSKEQTYSLSRFATTIPVRLKDLYDTANYIVQMSQYSRFMGVATLNWISTFSGLDSGKLPPMADYDVSFDEIRWRASAVKDNVMAMLEAYVPAVQLGGTISFRDPRGYQDPFIRGMMASMTLPQNVTTGIEGKFLYLGWPIYLDFGGESLGPQTASMPLFDILPFKDYSFSYDLSYPFIAKLTDPSAFRGAGYGFMFAIETNIRGNQPINGSYEKFVVPSPSEEIVSYFCDSSQRNSGTITVAVYDAATGEPLEDAAVFFLGSQQCTIGTTNIIDDPFAPNYGDAVVSDNFPVGIGTLRVTKPFYLDNNTPYATDIGKDDYVRVNLKPYKTIKANFVKLTYDDPYILPVPSLAKTVSLGSADIIIPDLGFVTITKIGHEDEMPAAFFAPSENETEIMLSPGDYEVNAVLVYNSSVTLPEKEECKNWDCSEKVKLPQQTFPKYLYNSLKFDWEVNASDLYNSSSVTFYIITPPVPKTWDDMKRNGQITDVVNTDAFYPRYAPRFSKSTT